MRIKGSAGARKRKDLRVPPGFSWLWQPAKKDSPQDEDEDETCKPKSANKKAAKTRDREPKTKEYPVRETSLCPAHQSLGARPANNSNNIQETQKTIQCQQRRSWKKLYTFFVVVGCAKIKLKC